jgi:4-diphosphocytidyl-2-C-methyl-D-erythritol kinase
MESITLNAPAKINLALDVTGKRDNGYHDVRMIMQQIDLCDEITITKNVIGTDRQISIETDTEELPLNEDNLIYKAASLIMEECSIDEGVSISLKKRIPIAAGMAGGSTDAAAVLKGMNILFDAGLSDLRLRELGVRIGADIPYCIMGGTALSEGIGEILTPLKPMPGCTILIAKPTTGVSTKYVYTKLDSVGVNKHPDIDGMIEAIDKGDIGGISTRLMNVLENVTVEKCPVIKEIKRLMLEGGASGALMSGSGPTVFALFDDREEAKACAEIIEKAGIAGFITVTGPYKS